MHMTDPDSRFQRVMRALVGLGAIGLLTSTVYLLTLLSAAVLGRTRRQSESADGRAHPLHCVVVVPAHDEGRDIVATVEGLRQLDYPADAFDVVVVADNCSDATAALARAAGARVIERDDPSKRGKGFALAFAFEQLLDANPCYDAFVVVDADCTASPNLLTAITDHLAQGAAAVQVNDVVANPEESWSAALRYAAFALIDTVRPMGKSALGMSAGLFGTGMGFARSTLERHPWSSYSLAEDIEYHLRLVKAGERSVFEPNAWVRSAMPATLQQARGQHLRWEGGRWELIRRTSPQLARIGIKRRDLNQIHAAAEPLVPPQAVLFAGNVLVPVLALLLRSPRLGLIASASLLGQVCYVIGGLLVVGAPRAVYRALLFAPLLVAWKLWLWLDLLVIRRSAQWVRAERS
jgi:hypothetical protein